jgi:DEAD/DEAH box helicase domain-containing protein
MSLSFVLAELRKNLATQGQIAHLEILAAREADYAELDPPFPPTLADVLTRRGLRLYRHQVEAIRAVRSGRDTILATPTASGKSLAFNLPVLESLLVNRFGTALYLYPLKALANDQLGTLLAWDRDLAGTMRPAIYDGDTPASAKRRILERSRLILTNPYALHEYLPWHHLWRRFFMNLKFVVIDEAHVYRGIFGSHVSALLRRLDRILAYYRAQPVYILASATINNAQEFAGKLLGRDVVAVQEDGSPHGQKYFILWNPPLGETGQRRSSHLDARDLVIALAQMDLQTLCFSGSRAITELLTRWTREELAKKSPELVSRVASYRAGYLPEERRELERKLRQRELQVLFSTNALELGIDIGSLDAVVMVGYPGTMISTRQQAGRAGRGQEDALAALVAYPNPLDQYFIGHPDRFFGNPLENALLNPENPQVLKGHLLCAAAELPLETSEVSAHFGPAAVPLYEDLENEGKLAGGQYRGEPGRASQIVSLNNLGDRAIQLIAQGTLLETLDFGQALRETYPGAIYLHQGETYRIQSLDWERGYAEAIPLQVDLHTQSKKDTDIQILKETARRLTPEGIEAFLGEVLVRERIYGYYIKKFDRILEYHELDLPELAFTTMACWWKIPVSLRLEAAHLDFDGGLHALEHAGIALTPLFALCDRWDLGGVSYPDHPTLQTPAVFLYDGAPGGVGIGEKVFEVLPELLRMTLEMVRDCRCEEGCPSCILSPKCGNNNQPISKAGAIWLLERLLAGPS